MTKREREKIVRELHRAAEQIETGKDDYCCHAIDSRETVFLFASLFKEDALGAGNEPSVWFEMPHEHEFMPSVRARRVLGLLWCAELVRTGELG